MDNICEQLIKITPTAKDRILSALVWAVSFVLVFICVYISMKVAGAIAFMFLLFVAVCYGAFKITNLFKIEYEYTIVNQYMDFDKIVAKSNRKRMLSIKLNEVQEYGEYTEAKANALKNKSFDARFVFCNPYDEAQYMIYAHPKKGTVLVLLAMNENTKDKALKAIPRIVQM